MRESSSVSVRDVLTGLDLLSSSRLTYVEARSALAAARRSRRVSRRQFTSAGAQLEQRWQGIDVIEVGMDVARLAGRLAERHALRSHDAIQLASSLVLDDRSVVMVTLDVRLRRAAGEAGLAIAPR